MNKRSMRILGFSQIRDMLVRLAPSRLSKEAARALNPDYGYSTLFGKGEARSDFKCR